MNRVFVAFRFIVLVLCVATLQSCFILKPVKTGETYFQEKQYRLAAKLLAEEIDVAKEDTTKARKAFLAGESYRLSNAPVQAEPFYKRAVDLDYGPMAIYYYARTLKANGKYKEAIEQFKIFQNSSRAEDYEVGVDIKGAELAIEWQNKPRNYRVNNLMEINSAAFDYAPTIFENNGLLFTSDRSTAEGIGVYGWT